MSLDVIANKEHIVATINEFSTQYHTNYFEVRNLAANYITSPDETNAELLANQFRKVLCCWGAGKRKSPAVQNSTAIQKFLLDTTVQKQLVEFVNMPLTTLAIRNNYTQRVINGDCSAEKLEKFDLKLHLILSKLSTGVLVNNASVTYPMKSLLLLTGFMPAFDSRVRKGLGMSGFSGTDVTQFNMPKTVNSAGAKKISCLPFMLADCYAKNTMLFDAAISASNYPQLLTEPGRVFDVLLFMQGAKNKKFFTLVPTSHRWYQLS